MKVRKLESKLDDILDDDNVKGYYLDFFPATFGENSNFFDFEEFMQKKYYADFAKKISFIILSLISYYDSVVYLISKSVESQGFFFKEIN